jgi:putative glutamine amidotransferase
MDAPPPRIGITTGIVTTTTNDEVRTTYTVPSDYIRSVSTAGGLPILLPPERPHVDAFLDLVDGLVLIGGADIDPARYGDEPHPATAGVNADLDIFEITLLNRAWDRDIPTLCICRGIQVLNVARGGTLIQDLPDQAPSPIGHQQRVLGKKRGAIGHSVQLADGINPLREIMGGETVEVNTFHHQAIRDVAPGLDVLATAPDGIVEAVHDQSRTFLLGVQWHPEGMAAERAEELALFQELIAKASARTAVAH